MLRQFNDRLNSIFTWMKRKQIVHPDQEIVKVNLGSGLTVAEGWINIDGHMRTLFTKWPRFVLKMIYRHVQVSSQRFTMDEFVNTLKENRYIHHNLKYGIPLKTETVDYLYSSHFLEHLFLSEAIFFLKEACRVMRPGGVFRIVVPDLSYAFGLYTEGKKQKALNYFFEQSPADEFTYHRYLYDFELLRDRMKEAGFQKVQQCSYRKGSVPDIHILDRLPEESLFVEAIK
ncbi:methyltransferase domain-containing protein [bacterium]|nr:methyltransferase domain-containing protein [bacterium]